MSFIPRRVVIIAKYLTRAGDHSQRLFIVDIPLRLSIMLHMPKISISHSFDIAPEKAYEKVKTFLDSDIDLRKLDPNYQCHFDDSNLSGHAKGGRFQAELLVTPIDSGSQVNLTIKLPLFAAPFKAMVEKIVRSKLNRLET